MLFISGMLALEAPAAQPAVAPLPDLIAARLEVLPTDARPGDAAQIRATIANQGLGDASGFFVLLRVNSQILRSQFITELKSNAQTQLQAPWVVGAGLQKISLEVDSPSRVAESDEQNNTLTLELHFGADLVFTNLTLTPEFPKPGQQTRITATVRNLGTQDVTSNFAVQFAIGRKVIARQFLQQLRSTAELRSGEEQAFEANWVAEAGEQVIRVSVDPFGVISEADEINNSLTRILDISSTPPTGADLITQDLQLEPPAPEPGQTVTLRATVANQGQGQAPSFTVSFQVDGQTIATLSVPELSPASTLFVQATWKAEEGIRFIRVKADSAGRIPELNEENNAVALSVDLGPPLNRCGQFAFLQIREDAFSSLEDLTGLSHEEVQNAFLPQMKRVMEEQYSGVNVRFTLSRPARSFATILFGSEDRGNILGEAPLGLRFGTAQVHLGSFVRGGRLLGVPLSQVAIALATVASHELGHLLGLGHTSQSDSKDIMSANAELSVVGLATPPQFTSASLQQLQRLLPLTCP